MAGFSAKRTIALPLLLYYLQLAVFFVSSNSLLQKEDNNQILLNEKYSLWNLYKSTKQKEEVNWDLWMPTCNWSGVTCDENNEHIIALNLPGKSFIGHIRYDTIGALTRLRKLSLGNNMFSGTIPPDFKNLEQLKTLSLPNNDFHGKFPPEISQLKNLRNIDISGNRFSGKISWEDFKNLDNLMTLDLSSNNFSGEFPREITQLKTLKIIDISRNRFSGQIPCDLQYLPLLSELRLGHNMFTGMLPGLHLGKLVNFSMEYNNITGAVPDTLSHLGKEAFEGTFLCDPPLTSCRSTSPSRSYVSLRSYCPSLPSLENPDLATFAMSGGGALFLLLFLIILLCPVQRKKRPPAMFQSFSTQSTTSSAEQKTELFIFPDNNPMTGPSWAKGLDVAVLMSSEVMKSPQVKGNTGTYKVELGLTDNVVVVKKLLDPEAVALYEQDFANKMNFLGKIECHDNVMPLRGCCIYNETYLLIYDFFPAGSLYHRLHVEEEEETELVLLDLEWESRKRIAWGAARGVAHLHMVVKLVHGNIKSSNILLDRENPAKSCVADFGLTPTPPTGYYDPATGKASFESDVYAFGVLLLELLTGKSPRDENLPEWVQPSSGGATHEIWDSKMDKEKMVESEMVRLFQIAKECTQEAANERPKMEKVASMIGMMCGDRIEKAAEPVVDQDVIHEDEDSSLHHQGTPPPPPLPDFTP